MRNVLYARNGAWRVKIVIEWRQNVRLNENQYNLTDLLQGVVRKVQRAMPEEGLNIYGNFATVKTLEGDHRAIEGDWIIQGVKGELYPCKPDIFALTYEAVEP